jgi:copper ion binding protein
MTNKLFNVPDIHCDHCASSIEGAVRSIEGVEKVKVQIEDRTVEVTYDDGSVKLDEIVSAIEGQGYEVKS